MAAAAAALKQDPELTLEQQVAHFVYDPLGFVYWAYPWGVEGTRLAASPADPKPGPDLWQIDFLDALGQAVAKNAMKPPSEREAVMIAIASGHGPGKTAALAWVNHWFMSTRRSANVVVTANTKTQLTTKTWRELGIWHDLAINRHWFGKTATKFYAKWNPTEWSANAIPWTKENSEAFAGTHADHVLVIMDEGSAIDDVIWEVIEGAMTTGEVIWIVFGNPTRNTGRFRECFRKQRHRWITRQIDSRKAKLTNKKVIQRQIEDYGEDSDFVRVRVKGMFPRRSVAQLIPEDYVLIAQKRSPFGYEHAPLIFGVDTARFGDDQTVIYMRQGAATRDVRKYRGLDEVQIADEVAKWIILRNPQAVFIGGGGGYGGGAYDHLRRRQFGDIVTIVNEGSGARDPVRFGNKRMEMWWDMMEWLRDVGCIDERDQELYDDLIGPEYHYGRADGKNADCMYLESKDDMKARELPSPDIADALSLTFAYPVHPLAGAQIEHQQERRRRAASRPWQAN